MNTAGKRAHTKIGVETEVLTLSSRKCALCFGIDQDFSEKAGQIAHIDGDPSNGNIGNLAFLCLFHHDRYDGSTSQSKGITRHELKKYRSLLYAEVTRLRSTIGFQGDNESPMSSLLKIGERLGMLGFADLRASTESQAGFHTFLNDNVLPYFSRDLYVEDTGISNVELSESSLIGKVNDETSSNIVLISGPGGVGKTRLAGHICRVSNATMALRLANNNPDYNKLYQALEASKDYLNHLAIFIDYAESISFSESLYAFRDLAHRNLDIRVTVILCSRVTGNNRVQDVFPNIDIEHRIGAQLVQNDTSFEEWLVSKILGHFGLLHKEGLKEVCTARPVLAAFAGFLTTYHPEAFDRQFSFQRADPRNRQKSGSNVSDGSFSSLIIKEEPFRHWLRKRLAAFEKFGVSGKRRAAEIALALPFYNAEDQTRVVRDDAGIGDAALETLEDDGWIDPVNNGLRHVAHDTLADGLISEHVFGGDGRSRPTKRLRELLQTAAERKYFGRALRAFDRLASDANLRQIDTTELIKGLAEKNKAVLQACALDILRSRLIKPEQVPILLEKVESFSEGLDNDRNAYSELSRIAVILKRRRSTSLSLNKYPRFLALVSKAANRPDARTLANLVSFDPARQGARGAAYIKRNKTNYHTAFVIQAYLRASIDPAVIGQSVISWLDQFGISRGASYVLTAWFQAIDMLIERGEVWNPSLELNKTMEDKLEAWCIRHRLDLNACWNLQSLIDQIGVKRSEKHLVAWMGRHSTTYYASHILQKWLRATEGWDSRLFNWIKAWLEAPISRVNHKEAAFLFRDLRDCVFVYDSLSFEDFADILLTHIGINGPLHQRRDLCRYWLELGGDPDQVKSILQKLVQQDVTDPDVRFCFEGWSNAETNEPLLFHREMKYWLEENASHPKASYVFNIWDKHGLNLGEISNSLRTWLKHNFEDIQFSVQLSKYIKADPDGAKLLGPTEEKAPVFLSKTAFKVQECRSIEFILQSPFGSNPSSPIFELAIAASGRYFRQHIYKDASAFLVAVVIRSVGNLNWIKLYADDWLEMFPHRHRASLIYQAMLDVDEHPENHIEGVRDWFSENQSYQLAGGLLLAWVKAGGDPVLLKSEAKMWLRASFRQGGYPDAEEVKALYMLD